MTATNRVLVPLGPRTTGLRALPVAATLARASEASVEVVVVIPEGAFDAPAVETAQHHAHRVGVWLDAVLVRHHDDVLDALIEEAGHGRTLLCMATHERGTVEDDALRSLDVAVACRSLDPLVLVGPKVVGDHATRLDGVVACVDERAPAAGVLAAAVPWARRLGGGVHVVEVAGPPAGAGGDHDGDHDGDDGDGTGWTSAPVAASFAGGGVQTEWGLLRGRDPAGAILAAVHRCGHPLVVMGAQGDAGVGRHVGHVTSAVVEASPSPVLLVPPR